MSKTVPAKTTAAHDPFALARTFFGMDPFFGTRENPGRARFVPSFEVKETEEAYVLSADVPGVKDEDLDISIHRNVLTVSGSRHSEERKEGENYHLYERQYGEFARSFSLPDEADGDSVAASMDAGVLTIRVAKKAQSKPRKISVGKA